MSGQSNHLFNSQEVSVKYFIIYKIKRWVSKKNISSGKNGKYFDKHTNKYLVK